MFKFLDPDGGRASAAHYTELFNLYAELVASPNYVLKRQSLKLLSEFLLDRDNFRIMMRYISDRCVGGSGGGGADSRGGRPPRAEAVGRGLLVGQG